MCYVVARYKPEWLLQNHFSPSHGSIGRRILLEQKIIERGEYCLLTFLEDQYRNKGYKLWPVLVRAHCVRPTLQCLKSAGIPFLKEGNPSPYPWNAAYRRHVGHFQAAGIHRGLDNHLWTAADQWDKLHYQISGHGGAWKYDEGPPPARAPCWPAEHSVSCPLRSNASPKF